MRLFFQIAAVFFAISNCSSAEAQVEEDAVEALTHAPILPLSNSQTPMTRTGKYISSNRCLIDPDRNQWRS